MSSSSENDDIAPLFFFREGEEEEDEDEEGLLSLLSLSLSRFFFLRRKVELSTKNDGDENRRQRPRSFSLSPPPHFHVPPLILRRRRDPGSPRPCSPPSQRRASTPLDASARRTRPRERSEALWAASVFPPSTPIAQAKKGSRLGRFVSVMLSASSPSLALAALVAHAPLAGFSLLAAFVQSVLRPQSGFM